MREDTELLIMISAIEHYSYCPRQCALIYIEQEYKNNVDTQRGNYAHRRVDKPHENFFTDKKVIYSLPLFSDRLGLIGKADEVEFLEDGTPYPVEYKYGRKRQKLHDDLQLAAQAICLEEMTGKSVPLGAIFHCSSNHRREVKIDQTLRDQLENIINDIRIMYQSKQIPPAVNDARCKHCSIHDICQPEALAAKSQLHKLRKILYVMEEPCNKF